MPALGERGFVVNPRAGRAPAGSRGHLVRGAADVHGTSLTSCTSWSRATSTTTSCPRRTTHMVGAADHMRAAQLLHLAAIGCRWMPRPRTRTTDRRRGPRP